VLLEFIQEIMIGHWSLCTQVQNKAESEARPHLIYQEHASNQNKASRYSCLRISFI
jgi:hypothetical protein